MAEFEVLQAARLGWEPKTVRLVSTWHKARIGAADGEKLTEIRSQVGELTNAFLNDYLAANPKSRN